jgi:molybdopterin biosynthesis enzyme
MERLALEDALDLVLSGTVPITETQNLPLLSARGLIASETICAPLDSPPFD